jgi:hypothetical protein
MASIWDRVKDLQESVTSNTQQNSQITLKTSIVKISLGMYLGQSLLIAVILSIKYNSSTAWLIPISSILQIGWIWNKVTDSWREQGYTSIDAVTLDESEAQSLNPPDILIGKPE